jgi:hypothetical protein
LRRSFMRKPVLELFRKELQFFSRESHRVCLPRIEVVLLV